jgi:hypothetical protein
LIDAPADTYMGGVLTASSPDITARIAEFDSDHAACHTFVGCLPPDASMREARAQLHLLCDRLKQPVAVMPGHETDRHYVVFEDGNVRLTLADVADLLKAGDYQLPVVLTQRGVFMVTPSALVEFFSRYEGGAP